MGQTCQVLFLSLYLITSSLLASTTSISKEDYQKIATKIWHNECGERVEGLVSWKDGESWVSLGIGHFIWYPDSFRGPYEETFPSLLRFMESYGATLPVCLRGYPPCPWKTKEEFDKNKASDSMSELRSFLYETQGLQVWFIVQRMEEALPLMEHSVPLEKKERLRALVDKLLQDPRGVFAMIDYVNCKGTGLQLSERYQGVGWGLLQVLDRMSLDAPDVVQEFVKAAELVLKERVEHSPPEREERNWLKGWCNRLESYLSD